METRRQRQLSEYLLWYTSRVVKEQPPRKIPLVFFRTSSGSEPVREWLKRLDESDRRAIGQDLLRAQWRWPVAMPLCRAMGSGLWEVRTTLAGNRASRVLMCVCENHLVALHGFIKKTRATPDNDLALAKKRQTELEQ
jgi:phage-related protein